nr:hypothetical protein [Leucobacter chromiiresistens]
MRAAVAEGPQPEALRLRDAGEHDAVRGCCDEVGIGVGQRQPTATRTLDPPIANVTGDARVADAPIPQLTRAGDAAE